MSERRSIIQVDTPDGTANPVVLMKKLLIPTFAACLLAVLCGVVLADPLIIDPKTDWGARLIKEMMDGINKEELDKKRTMTFIDIIDTLGDTKVCTVYVHVLDQTKVKYSCTVKVTLKDPATHTYDLGAIECHLDH